MIEKKNQCRIFISLRIGFLKDVTKTYNLAFVIGGTMIIIGALFHFCISCVEPERREDEEEENIKA